MQRLTMILLTVCLAALGICGAPQALAADESADGGVSKIISIQGNVVVRRQGETVWRPVQLNDTLMAGDQIHVAANSRAGIVLSNDAVLRLDQNTTLILTDIRTPATGHLSGHLCLETAQGRSPFFQSSAAQP